MSTGAGHLTPTGAYPAPAGYLTPAAARLLAAALVLLPSVRMKAELSHQHRLSHSHLRQHAHATCLMKLAACYQSMVCLIEHLQPHNPAQLQLTCFHASSVVLTQPQPACKMKRFFFLFVTSTAISIDTWSL